MQKDAAQKLDDKISMFIPFKNSDVVKMSSKSSRS